MPANTSEKAKERLKEMLGKNVRAQFENIPNIELSSDLPVNATQPDIGFKLDNITAKLDAVFKMLFKMDRKNAPLCDTCACKCGIIESCKDYKRKE